MCSMNVPTCQKIPLENSRLLHVYAALSREYRSLSTVEIQLST